VKQIGGNLNDAEFCVSAFRVLGFHCAPLSFCTK